MYKKILVPMALDHGISPRTLEVARVLRTDGGEIIALHVYEAPQDSVRAYLGEATLKAGFEHARERLHAKLADLPDVTPVILSGHTARSVIDYADSHDIDCIVLGSHKPGLRDYLIGSTAARVVRHASCSVHVVR